ncbi:hypothetical protein GH811_09400 [Acetobacterium malicum]|uniref:Uncharacterized protein n=1 Tax=Acetobacterium malicum TaxID=52692 RepID=A0ABR6YXA0_9FIRM|nr:hypothetical protein [Acetobacterium malicum]MBC3899829.1 hypothetical protein [Acetobacterium malicum]
MAFKRRLDQKKIEKIKKTVLWNNHLLPDIKAGVVFPAIRDEEVHFYYSGGCMFKYSGDNFKFNRSYFKPDYQTVTTKETWKNYKITSEIYEKDYASLSFICKDIVGFDFCEEYENIKEVVKQKFYKKNDEKSITERKYLEKLYPFTFGPEKSDVIVLDIEVRANFKTYIDKKAEYAKCDLVLYNTLKSELQFIEAKLCSDKRVKSRGMTPEVIEQIEKYNSWFKENEDRDNILENYKNYISIINQLFEIELAEPNTLKNTTKLALFEGNDYYKKTHLHKLVNSTIGADNIAYYLADQDQKITNEIIWNDAYN